MIKCLLVDDEPWALELLTSYVTKVPGLQLVAATDKPLEALALANPATVDIVFLDIQMPELNGLQFMKAVDNKCKVIITSAYTEYAIEGFEHNVVDYLLKPISFERFYKAVQKVTDQLMPAKQVPAADHIFIKTDSKLVKVSFEEIVFLEGARDYVLIHTTRDTIITLDSLRNLEDLLPATQFIRIHKSYLVSIGKIDSIEKNRIMIGQNVLPIGESHKAAFLAAINKSN